MAAVSEARPSWPIRAGDALEEAFGILWDYLVVNDARQQSDVIFCFGSRHREVPKRAAELFAAGQAPLILVSGGAPIDGVGCEADVFAQDLVALGVPADRIVAERKARNTGENVVLGLGALSGRLVLRRVTAVSWPLAARRCLATFGRHDPSLVVRSAPAVARPDEPWPATTRAIRAALGEWDRTMRYARLGYTIPQRRPLAVRRAARLLRRELRRDPVLAEAPADGLDLRSDRASVPALAPAPS